MRAESLTLSLPCDIRSGCMARNDELVVDVRFGTVPRALQPFPVQVSVTTGQAVESVAIGFSMRGMDMGLNRYRLVASAPHDWRGDITLPICISGRSDWLADVEVTAGGNKYHVAVPFVLEK
ncbi:MAG TPA: hypothetical protein ENJ80_04730 [Gammaproteobacteria bacterium]|nr:hypothetical protein [Gammaproteobacteria bacterium]